MADNLDDEILDGSFMPGIGLLPPRAFYTPLMFTLQYCRQMAHLTQSEVQSRYGIDQSQLSDLENGRVRRPHNSTLQRLSSAYAEHIPGTSEEFLYSVLMQAKEDDREYRAEKVSDELSKLDMLFMTTRFGLYPPKVKRYLYYNIMEMFNGMDELLKHVRFVDKE